MSINGSTRLIKVEPVDPTTDATNPVEEGTYPCYLSDARREYPNITFSDEYKEDDALLPQGYLPVYPTEAPKGDIVERGRPELREDGKYYETWSARDYTEQELADNLAVAQKNALYLIDQCREQTYAQGFKDVVGEGDDAVTNVYSLTQDNQQLLVAVRLLANESAEDRIFKLRTVDNRPVSMNTAELKRVTTAILEHCLAILEMLGDLADQVLAATKIEDVPAIPETVD